MYWSESSLKILPRKQDIRLRGSKMTRLETFSDAAFAFAVTMLVVSVGSIPRDYAGLMQALKGVPAFAASFAAIMSVWGGHRKWSRRYGRQIKNIQNEE